MHDVTAISEMRTLRFRRFNNSLKVTVRGGAGILSAVLGLSCSPLLSMKVTGRIREMQEAPVRQITGGDAST